MIPSYRSAKGWNNEEKVAVTDDDSDFGVKLFYLFVNTGLSNGCVKANEKAHAHLDVFLSRQV